MSDDIVNQLTLNFLISKNQLQKLNKKIKEDKDDIKQKNTELYGDKIKLLFSDLLVNNPPDDLLYEVKNSFDNFFDKCVYYFKSQEHNTNLENHSNDNDNVENDDFEKESKNIENGDYIEIDNNVLEVDNNVLEVDNNVLETNTESSVYVTKKYTKNTLKLKNGVENIQQLPINWLQNIKRKPQ
jgi:hypothetical protein